MPLDSLRRFSAVFIDRDGTLVRDVRHNADPARIELLDGAVEALQALQAADFRLVVITNQSGVARGHFGLAEAEAMGAHLAERLAASGVRLDGYYLCPHYATGRVPEFAIACDCRKPAPGLLLRAARELDLDLGRAWMLGDMLTDVGAARAAGVRPILVDIGSQHLAPDARPPVVARNLAHAAALILAADGGLTGVPSTSLELFSPVPAASLPSSPRPADERGPGERDPLPDAGWQRRAQADAAALRRLLGGV